MSWISAHDYRRRRADRVLHLLQQLWGDELPPGPEAELTALVDAITCDDQLGAHDGYVVQSDRLRYDTLALLLSRCTTPEVTAHALPRELLSRVFSAGDQHEAPAGPGGSDDGRAWTPSGRRTWRTWWSAPGTVVGGRGAAGPAGGVAPGGAGPGNRPSGSSDGAAALLGEMGTWHLDAEERVLSWDETCAAVLGRLQQPRCRSLVEEVEEWLHPDDRPRVLQGFDRCVRTAEPHQVHFRALDPGGGWISCLSSGRRLVDAGGRVHVVGVLQRDSATTTEPTRSARTR